LLRRRAALADAPPAEGTRPPARSGVDRTRARRPDDRLGAPDGAVDRLLCQGLRRLRSRDGDLLLVWARDVPHSRNGVLRPGPRGTARAAALARLIRPFRN